MNTTTQTLWIVWTRDLFGHWSPGGAHYADRQTARDLARHVKLAGWDNGRRCVIDAVMVMPKGVHPAVRTLLEELAVKHTTVVNGHAVTRWAAEVYEVGTHGRATTDLVGALRLVSA